MALAPTRHTAWRLAALFNRPTRLPRPQQCSFPPLRAGVRREERRGEERRRKKRGEEEEGRKEEREEERKRREGREGEGKRKRGRKKR